MFYYKTLVINDFVKSIKSLPLKTVEDEHDRCEYKTTYFCTRRNYVQLINKLCSVYPHFRAHFIYDDDIDHISLIHTCFPFTATDVELKWGQDINQYQFYIKMLESM